MLKTTVLYYSTNESGAGVFNTEKLSMVIYWPNAVPGSKVLFHY